jgi:hypothetical protein
VEESKDMISYDLVEWNQNQHPTKNRQKLKKIPLPTNQKPKKPTSSSFLKLKKQLHQVQSH